MHYSYGVIFSQMPSVCSCVVQTLEKMEKAELEVGKLEAQVEPPAPLPEEEEKETLSEEVRYTYMRLGLKMKAYLEMGKQILILTLLNFHRVQT